MQPAELSAELSKLGLTMPCMWHLSGYVSAVFLEGIGWNPENAVGDALEYAQNVAGETSWCGCADPHCWLCERVCLSQGTLWEHI